MPKIPMYQRNVSIPGETGSVENPLNLMSGPAQALTKIGTEIEGAGFRALNYQRDYEITQKRASDYVEALKTENSIKNEVDAHAHTISRLSNVDDVDAKTDEFLQYLPDKYGKLAAGKDPTTQKQYESIVQSQLFNVQKLRRDAKSQIITKEGLANLEDTSIKFKELYRAAGMEERKFLESELQKHYEDAARVNIIRPDQAITHVQVWKQKAQYNGAVDSIMMNAQKYLDTPNKDEVYGTDALTSTQRHELDMFAIGQRESGERRKEREEKVMQEKNAEKLSDATKQLADGKMEWKTYNSFLMTLRNPDPITGLLPINRQQFEHYQSLSASVLRGENKIPPDPATYLQINEAIGNPNNPMKQEDLTPFIGVLPPSAIQHFSDKILNMELATGRRGENKEQQEKAKLRTDIERDEKIYVKNALGDMSIDADKLWDLNLRVEKTINDAHAKGTLDRAAIHEEIKNIVNPITSSWIMRTLKVMVGIDPDGPSSSASTPKEGGGGSSYNPISPPPSPSRDITAPDLMKSPSPSSSINMNLYPSTFDAWNTQNQEQWVHKNDKKIQENMKGKPAGIYPIFKNSNVSIQWNGAGGYSIMIPKRGK